MLNLEEALVQPYMETPVRYLESPSQSSLELRPAPHHHAATLAMLEGADQDHRRSTVSLNSSMGSFQQGYSYTAPDLANHPAFKKSATDASFHDLEWVGDDLEDFRNYVQAAEGTSDHLTW